MADLYMPRSIPNPGLDSLSWVPAFDNILRTQVGVGFKTRRIANGIDQFTCSLYLTTVEMQILFDFYTITCQEVTPFLWWDWRWPSLTDRYATYSWQKRPSHAPWGRGYFKVDLTLLVEETYVGNVLLDIYDSEVWPTT